MGNINETISRGLLLLSFIMVTAGNARAVSVTANALGTMPSVINESSGLDYTGGAHFWTMNDGGGNKNLYKVAMDGTVARTVTVTNATNRNWEDLTHDAGRVNMYIGDFGNNANDRTNLKIWKIPYPSTVTGSTVTAEEISYTYSDQDEFPSRWMNFDVEAFIHFNSNLYIFTKPDLAAVGYTKMYRLSDSPGAHVAVLVDSFYTNDRPTGADISPSGLTMVLTSNTHIHVFTDFNGDDFFGGDHIQLNISGSWTQKEAVTFAANDEIYMSDESPSGGRLYHIDLSQWAVVPPPPAISTTSIEKIDASEITVYPSPANQFATISIGENVIEKMSVALYDITGKVIYEAKVDDSLSPVDIRTADFPSGVYFYKIFSEAKEIRTARLIVTH